MHPLSGGHGIEEGSRADFGETGRIMKFMGKRNDKAGRTGVARSTGAILSRKAARS